ncbi:MAG TPA: UDP-3-O-(3-hydroxymyristoyl)glucosamine N-acyltransferase [Terriglobales bacterium]|nr:UDP-3-O-(3-hydroxymyristoyl)glucosamine N-acyltransferase [Terriglobales bacterium]
MRSLAEASGARIVGDPAREIQGIASIESATADDIVFADDQERFQRALASKAGAVVAGEFATGAAGAKPLLIGRQPRIVFSRVAAVIQPRRRPEPGIHSTAIVHDLHGIGKLVRIGPHVVIGENTTVADRASIAAGTYVGANAKIGADTHIGANVTVYSGTILGERCVIHAGAVLGSDGFGYIRNQETGRYEKFPQVGRLIIGDDVEIGANATIDRGALDATIIGNGVKIDNLVHVAHNVIIGENVVIAAQTGISGSSAIEHDVVIAGQVGIADHVVIEAGAVLGAQCGIPTKKVIRGKGETFWGTPARPLRGYLKELAALARLAKKEP